MTDKQWLFTYLEIMHNRRKAEEKRVKEMVLLFKQIRIAGLSGHPKMDPQTSLDAINDIKMPGEQMSEAEIESAFEFVKNHEDIFPETLEVTLEDTKKNNVPKGRIDKKLGIVIPE